MWIFFSSVGGAGEAEGDYSAGDLGAPGALVDPVAPDTSGALGALRVHKSAQEI